MPHFAEGDRIEAGDDDLVKQLALLDHARQRLGFAASVPIHIFDFYVDDAPISHQIEYLLQSGNRSAFK